MARAWEVWGHPSAGWVLSLGGGPAVGGTQQRPVPGDALIAEKWGSVRSALSISPAAAARPARSCGVARALPAQRPGRGSSAPFLSGEARGSRAPSPLPKVTQVGSGGHPGSALGGVPPAQRPVSGGRAPGAQPPGPRAGSRRRGGGGGGAAAGAVDGPGLRAGARRGQMKGGLRGKGPRRVTGSSRAGRPAPPRPAPAAPGRGGCPRRSRVNCSRPRHSACAEPGQPRSRRNDNSP